MSSKRCLLVMTGAFALGGGIARANQLVIHALIDSGYMIDLYALNEDAAAVVYRNLPCVRQCGFQNNKLAFMLAIWIAIIRYSYEFVFCDHVNLAFSLVLPAKLGLIRYIVRLNGIEVFAPLPNFEGRMGLVNAWKHQAISQFTKDKVLAQFPNLQISVVDLALSPEQSAASEQNWAKDNSTPLRLQTVNGTMRQLGNRVLLLVGRMSKLEQYKGQDKLIESMPLVLAKHPDTQLVLVGKGDDSERLRMLACSYPPDVQQTIFMPGFVPDTMLEQLYRQCYAFVMPSRGEGFGLVYLEAMRYAKPCIGSRGDAAENIIQHTETGLLVENPASHQSVADAILELLDNPDRATMMGHAGYERLREYYLYPHFQTRLMNQLKSYS